MKGGHGRQRRLNAPARTSVALILVPARSRPAPTPHRDLALGPGRPRYPVLVMWIGSASDLVRLYAAGARDDLSMSPAWAKNLRVPRQATR